jgi:hypothetical protein
MDIWSFISKTKDLSDWLTAIGTIGAVVTALWLSSKDARRLRKEKEREQAERISGWMEELEENDPERKTILTHRLIVRNASEQLVYNLVASIVTANGSPVGRNEYRTYAGRVPPGQSQYIVEHPGHGMSKRFSIEVAFQDSGGRCWVRNGKGELKRTDKDPLSHYGIDPPVGWRMP